MTRLPGKLRFRPSIRMSILALAVIMLFSALGLWQISRGNSKQLIVDAGLKQQDLPALELNGAGIDYHALRFRKVVARGSFEPQFNVYLDNKTHQGQAGYQVVTPLRIAGTNSSVLVNRGWVAATQSRAQLPVVDTPAGEVVVHGILQLAGRDVAGFIKQNRSNTGWPALFRWIDVGELAAETGIPLKPYLILQDASDAHGFIRDWKLISDSPDKNYAYALQWFSFAGIIVLLWIGLNLKRNLSEV